MTNKLQKGFTLIELLVVIAIIGILASVVLASLNSARDKGSDAAIKANLANVRAQAELYYDNNSNAYSSAGSSPHTFSDCSTADTVMADTTITNAITAANDASSGSATCNGDASSWAISVPLNGGGAWCVDSSGQSASGTAASGACS